MVGTWEPGEGTRWELRCHSCGRTFLTNRAHALTCSARCRKRMSRGVVAPPVEEGAGPLILSLCDLTGSWAAPYREAGYRVRQVDLAAGQDVRLLPHPLEPVRGILAAPPCTAFCRLGASRWEAMAEQELLEALAVVDACLRLVAVTRPRWWALENPPGRLEKWLGPPDLRFEPHHYGDPWTKLTYLWGDFVHPAPAPVEPTQANRTVSLGSRVLRSQTPQGFARAFYLANP